MNSVPALSNVSEIGLTSGAPGTMGVGFAMPVRFPLPSPYNSIILPPVAGASPTKRFPCASRASDDGALSTYGAVKTTVLEPSPGKEGGKGDDPVVGGVCNEDCSVTGNYEGLGTGVPIANRLLCIENDRRGLCPGVGCANGESQDSEAEQFPLRDKILREGNGHVTALLYNLLFDLP
jgi:hypothetical protein